jgi:hypothetical protein
MDMSLMSNQPIPVRSQSVTVALLDATNAVKSTQIVATDASGNVSVPDVAGATQVKVTDASGNSLTVAIP